MTLRLLAAVVAMVLAGCGASRETAESPSPVSGTALGLEGRRLLTMGKTDSAVAVLSEALALDSSNRSVREDLALARYQKSLQGDSLRRVSLMRDAYLAYAELEERGATDMPVYDRLCELAQSIGDTAGFLLYARRAVERYPYDRQMLNLGTAQLAAERYRQVIESQKEALERFPGSSYRSGYYRLLGQAYVRVDRYQTAQRVLAEGVEEAENALAGLRADGPDPATLRRIEQDRIAMLLSLQRLYTIYQEQEKLMEVERRLKSAGRLQ
jgi:tetratricopeptide (TPR) repeat protein